MPTDQPRPIVSAALVILLIGAPGCGEGNDTSPGDGGSGAPRYAASFPTPPQVVNSGGPELLSPKWVPIFFSNDSASEVATLTDFFRETAASAYWQAVGEYRVGAVQSITPTNLAQTATGTIDDTNTAPTQAAPWSSGSRASSTPDWCPRRTATPCTRSTTRRA